MPASVAAMRGSFAANLRAIATREMIRLCSIDDKVLNRRK
jgi:hypothetical protein